MKKGIILQNQHFLKKNYIYNFFKASLKLNRVFLKNNLFFFKFFKIINFFLFYNFILKKNIKVYNSNYFLFKTNQSVFLKKKLSNATITNLYGNNYLIFKGLENSKQNFICKFNQKNFDCMPIKIFNYNYSFVFDFTFFLHIIIYNNIK